MNSRFLLLATFSLSALGCAALVSTVIAISGPGSSLAAPLLAIPLLTKTVLMAAGALWAWSTSRSTPTR